MAQPSTTSTGEHRTAPEVVFLSYTGALEPLGQSQVVPYLTGLASRGYRITLVSFEKPEHAGQTRRLHHELARQGIAWRPLRYHRSPAVVTTLIDVALAMGVVLRWHRRVDLLHARSDVPALAAFFLSRALGVPYVFDHRGLMAEEFADAGIWARGGILFRATTSWEHRFISTAAQVVVLTDRLATELNQPDRISVIPCAVDLARFFPAPVTTQKEFDLVHAGSLSGLYGASEVMRFCRCYRAKRPDARMLLLVPSGQPLPAPEPGVDARHAEPEDVPRLLRDCRAGLSFRRPGRAQVAASPVKVAEYWATGLPVVTLAGVGDLDALVESHRTGVTLGTASEDELNRAVRELAALVEESEATTRRCRSLAEVVYSLPTAVDKYDRVYRRAMAWRSV